jgi:hypothetical protein
MNELSPVVTLGAGFGGIGALKKLSDANVRIILALPGCDRRAGARLRSYAASPFSTMLPNQSPENKP